MTTNLKYVVTGLFVLFSMSIFTGCSENYQTYTFKAGSREGTVPYTFRLPSRYKLIEKESWLFPVFVGSNTADNHDPPTTISDNSEQDLEFPSIVIFPLERPTQFSSYQEYLEYFYQRLGIKPVGLIYDYETSANVTIEWNSEHRNDYQLLSRERVTVLGVPGEEIVYSYRSSYETDPARTFTVFSRETHFDHSGVTWQIQIEFLEPSAAIAEADYRHLLKTFKILK